MTTTPVTSTTTPPATQAPTAQLDNSSQQLAGNFDTFLQLLTTQLQNQDPTSPMDANQFTQELVEFSGVEQQINTNTSLQSLISLGQANSALNTVGFLGKDVTVLNGNAALQNGSADWTYNLGADSASTLLTVTNAAGQTVYSAPAETSSGDHDFSWDGTDNNGNTVADGTYTLNVAAKASDGSAVVSTVKSQGTVNAVDLENNQLELMIGPMSVPLSDVALISTPAAS
ncbi:MAG TPA: flagellar hook assembly protein FlgD [Rhizomicrobium sp.]|jgi:flagellar basal-body rod modification protein FlgD|nr:flagellar hook assembly protein FlgD [Rhizomicrobium sp.]